MSAHQTVASDTRSPSLRASSSAASASRCAGAASRQDEIAIDWAIDLAVRAATPSADRRSPDWRQTRRVVLDRAFPDSDRSARSRGPPADTGPVDRERAPPSGRPARWHGGIAQSLLAAHIERTQPLRPGPAQRDDLPRSAYPHTSPPVPGALPCSSRREVTKTLATGSRAQTASAASRSAGPSTRTADVVRSTGLSLACRGLGVERATRGRRAGASASAHRDGGRPRPRLAGTVRIAGRLHLLGDAHGLLDQGLDDLATRARS